MRIAVAGALGHIGSQLIRTLSKQFPDAQLLLIDNFTTQRYCSLFGLPHSIKIEFHEADVRDPNIFQILSNTDVVIHLAAITDAANSVNNPALTREHNLLSTLNIARACIAASAKLVHLSSTSVYGSQRDQVDESCPASELIPQSPYAETKLEEERALQSLVTDENLRSVSLRCGTVFGVSPGMRFHTAINKFVFQAAMRQPLTVWRTAENQKRPYLHIGDAVDALLHVIERDLFDGSIFNVLTTNATVGQILEIIRQEVESLDVHYVDHQIMNQLSYEVNDSRFRSTGFRPRGTLKTGIRDTFRLLTHG